MLSNVNNKHNWGKVMASICEGGNLTMLNFMGAEGIDDWGRGMLLWASSPD